MPTENGSRDRDHNNKSMIRDLLARIKLTPREQYAALLLSALLILGLIVRLIRAWRAL